MAQQIFKSLMGLQDMNQGSGTFTRATSTGGTATLSQVPFFSGTGSPEGVVAAGIGCLYARNNGGTNSAMYIKYSLNTGTNTDSKTGWSPLTIGPTNIGLASGVTYLGVQGSPLTTDGTMTLTAGTVTNSNQFVGSPNGTSGTVGLRALVEADLPARAFSIPVTLLDPSGARNVPVVRLPFPATVTAVKGFVVGGTSATINVAKNGTASHLSSNLVVNGSSTWGDGGAVQNTAYAIGDWVQAKLTALSGSPTEVVIQLDLTRP